MIAALIRFVLLYGLAVVVLYFEGYVAAELLEGAHPLQKPVLFAVWALAVLITIAPVVSHGLQMIEAIGATFSRRPDLPAHERNTWRSID
jgi:hypothetical protein